MTQKKRWGTRESEVPHEGMGLVLGRGLLKLTLCVYRSLLVR